MVSSKDVAITAAVAITDATDKSNPRTRMTRHWPSTTTPSGEALVRTFWRLFGERNPGANSAAPPVRTRQKSSRPLRSTNAPAPWLRNLGESGSAHAARLRLSIEDGYRRDHDQALNHPLVKRRYVQKVEDVVERLHEGDAQQGPENAAPPPGQRRATQNHRRDRCKVEIGVAGRIADSQPADEIDSGERGEQTRQAVDEQNDPAHRDADQARGAGSPPKAKICLPRRV